MLYTGSAPVRVPHVDHEGLVEAKVYRTNWHDDLPTAESLKPVASSRRVKCSGSDRIAQVKVYDEKM